jgi:hypothetical protein
MIRRKKLTIFTDAKDTTTVLELKKMIEGKCQLSFTLVLASVPTHTVSVMLTLLMVGNLNIHGSDAKFHPSVNSKGFEVFTAVVMKSIIFWDMTPCSLSCTRRFGGTYRLHLQGRRIVQQTSKQAGGKQLNGLHGIISQKMVLFG